MKKRPVLRYLAFYPLVGIAVFMLLSFVHDDFRIARSLESFYLPIGVGATMGAIIGYFRNKIETRTRIFERQLAKEREDAIMGRTAAAIAHEVRNPLNALAMGLQRLEIEARDLGSEHRRLVSLMLDSVYRANGIVGNLLSYARPQKPKMEDMRLDLLIEELLVFYGPQCEKHGIEVRGQIHFHESIRADGNLLRQVVENLLRNAIEAQPKGGFLEMELDGGGKSVELSVRNAGFTLSAGEAERIFEPYFTTKAQGTGLGLSISRRIIEAHEGRMTVRSGEDGRVEITLHLPVVRQVST